MKIWFDPFDKLSASQAHHKMSDEKSFNLPQEEEKVLEFWKKNKIFEKSLEKTKRGKPFTFYDGPPFATGLPHYGHILASTIKDVIPRYQTMRGRFVRRRWGWDCHGLPIEEIVERQVGISGKKQIEEKIGIAKFNEICRSTVLKYVGEWGKMVERMARWVEFEDSYKTMDRDYMESVWWGFGEVYKKGLVYEGRKVLLYCPRCETPVSSFEVAMDNSYKDVTDESATVKFRVKPGQKIGNWPVPENTYLLAWTTTPWTLPGNMALAIKPTVEYIMAEKIDGSEHIILTKDIYELYWSPFRPVSNTKFPGPVSQYRDVPYPNITRNVILGFNLEGLSYEPLFNVPAVKSDKAFKVYPADFVTTEEGTGIVHTAVVYGEDDYALGQKIGLPVVPLLDEKGKFNEKAPKFLRGMYFKKADKVILADLEERKLLFKKEKYTHSYPHCWRCSDPLFYNAIPAWFINIQKIKKKLLQSNEKEVNWFPGHLKHGRYEKSVEQAPDWNISRNRYWGNPIPVWKCRKCNALEVVGGIDELSKKARKSNNEYWIMRHGESETQLKKIIDSGQKKYHLTTIGKDEVARSAAKLKRDGIDMIVTSGITRTLETEKIAASVLGVKKIFVDKRLEEVKLGALISCHDEEYHKMFPTYESKFENGPEKGESLRDLRGRMRGFMEDMEKKYKGKKILLVSHDYPIWMLFHTAFGWNEKQAIKEKEIKGDNFMEPAQVEKLEWKIIPRDDTGEVNLHRPYIDSIVLRCAKCGGESVRTPEIFDSWTEAGSMPFAEYHYPFEQKKIFESRFPAQFVAEYIAQTRAWFYVMHVIGIIAFGKAPFENVVTTGTILAEDGTKMSKSKGNFPDPWEVINKYGVDSLRFYLMNSVVMQGDNLNFSVRDLESVYRKTNLILWNVYNYYKTYVVVEPWNKRPASDSDKANLDEWITGRTNELVTGVTGYLDVYDTVRATRLIQEYVDDISTWYIRRSRGRNDKAFFGTLRKNLLTTCCIIAPFMPYLAEMIYLGLGENKTGPESVHLADWPKADKKLIDKKLFESMAETRRIASLSLAKRAEAGRKVRQPLALLKIKPTLKIRVEEYITLKEEVNVKKVEADPKISGEVELDIVITPELREEGILRDLKRAIQELRQEAGLKPGKEIELMLSLPEELKQIVSRNEKFLKSEVSAKVINYRRSEKFGAESETKIDGVPVWIGIKKSVNKLSRNIGMDEGGFGFK
ncbi:MAG: class I tRNA ligase family protein [bacterium]|nr:class I tRNA ligase family protein [bacterium]